MTKIRKLIPILVCSFLVAGSGVAIAHSMHAPIINEAKATTSELTLSVGATNNKSGLYVNAPENDLPYSGDWNTRYYPTAAACIKVDGVNVANKLYPSSAGSNQSLAKFDTTRYFFDIGSSAIQNVLNNNSKITFGGTWATTVDAVEYSFTLVDLNLVWTGSHFVADLSAYDLEVYDTFTLRDAGIFNFEQVQMNTEDRGCLAYNSWTPSVDNPHCNFEFAFELQSYDATATPEFCLRLGSNGYWDEGHYFQFNAFVQANDCFTIGEWENGAGRLWHTGDIPCSIGGETHVFAVGNVRIKNTNNQITFVKIDGEMVYATVHSVPSAVALAPHIGLYHPGTDMSFRNAWAKDLSGYSVQTIEYDGEHGGPNGIYFRLPVNSGAYEEGNWDYRYYPTDRSDLLINGVEFVGWKQNLLVKFTSTRYYVALSDWGFGSQPVGTIFTIGGVFRRTVDGVSTFIYIQPRSFILTSAGWYFYDLVDLVPSTESQLAANDLLGNIGKWNPDHSKNCVKQFDQTVDNLVYMKDQNGNTGVYFTSSDATTHGEFRVYLPDNAYKAESKGYAMTRLSFDYMIDDSGEATATGRNHSLTADGYYVESVGQATNKFTIQALCHNGSNMYFDFDVELVNDGCLHTLTLDLAYGDVMGFCFVLWNFDGQFFMSNCHANYLEYNQALDELVYNSLKMYDYTAGGQCTSYYAGAKAAYEALSAAEKTIFNTEAAYGSARARLSAWALANGEVFDSVNGTFTPNTANAHGLLITLKDNNVVIISIVTGIIAIISIVGVALALKRRKYN